MELGVSATVVAGLLIQDSSIPGLLRSSNGDLPLRAEAEYHLRPLCPLSSLSSFVVEDDGSLVENRNFRESFLLLAGLENPYASSSEIANSFMSTISISSVPPRLSDSMRAFFDLPRI